MLDFSTKLADELKTRQLLVTEYEDKITKLQEAMANAAATGQLLSLGSSTSSSHALSCPIE
jgi:hypothetical protein